MTAPPLTDRERALLEEATAGCDPALRALAGDVGRGRILTIPEANLLREAIGDELTQSGIDAEAGAVNDRGRRLDDLVDRIGARSALHDP